MVQGPTPTTAYIWWLHDSTLLDFLSCYILPDNDAISQSVKSVEGYDDYLRGSDSGGVSVTMSVYTR